MEGTAADMTSGVAYLLAYSLRYAAWLATSLHTLRQHWTGPVMVLADATTEALARSIADSCNATVKVIDPFKATRNAAYVTKTMVPTWSPYDETLLLDADTTIQGPIDELFGHPLTLTQFSTWISTGRKMSGRIKWWKGKSPAIDAMVAKQFERPWPAINTGVAAWQRGNPALLAWNTITMAGAGTFISDELAMQLLQGVVECRVLGDAWNWSPQYGVADAADVRIVHFHGKKMLNKERGRALWEPAFLAAFAADVGGMQKWAGEHDESVRRLL